ncbi:MAG: aminotransferase class I/II-fold pyridoxal phosphate-dependent enzyme, partial [Armatimonadia bacterium]|nr:aminotransferase class I/II-fold pyridoxal phosphate-dependent enzyme [Armatimonadia bacterium]
KTYAMTGWRLGFAVCRPDLATHLARIETNVHSCTSAPVQWAGVEALTGPQDAPAAMADSFRRRGELITDLLNGIQGVKCQKPGGAFYVMANVSGACEKMGIDSAKEFCDRLLMEAGIAILPRTCFGRRLAGEEEYVRFSFATSDDQIRAGVARLKEFVEG